MSDASDGGVADDARPIDALSLAILEALLHGARGDEAMSLPRLAKRLGLGASVVLRQSSLISDAMLGGRPGPGWVTVVQQDGRWMVALTETGRRVAAGSA